MNMNNTKRLQTKKTQKIVNEKYTYMHILKTQLIMKWL